MALISDELWAATIRRAIELAKEHASEEEKPRMAKLHVLGLSDEFDGKKGEFGIIKVLKD
ncbi:MAG: hypothetical protein GC201_10215 [Alphaproteobacteria bacterium]|nr:hypothetical protein [Alphaproteobacteria bacterium]